MPNYRNEYFICLNGDVPLEHEGLDIRGSYYLSRSTIESYDDFISESKEVDLKLLKYKRRDPNETHTIPLCKINFIFDRYQRSTDPYRLDLSHDLSYAERFDSRLGMSRSNLSICYDILRSFLKNIRPYSIIYLNAHGGADESFVIYQRIIVPGEAEEVVSVQVPIWFIADAFKNFIPKASQNNLQIKLLICHGANVAPVLMRRMHLAKFKKTSVVGYHGVVKTTFRDGTITNFESEDDERHDDIGWQYRTSSGTRRQYGSDYTDNKLVAHNHSGNVVVEAYHEFKNREIPPTLDYFDKENRLKEGLIMMMEILSGRVTEYINYHNIQRSKSLKHGHSGIARANRFLGFLSEHKICVVENKRFFKYSFIDDEFKLLCELKDFCAKQALYAQFRGNINVNNHSCLTYLLGGIDDFYTNHGNGIRSNLLIQFGNYLNGSRGNRTAPITIYEHGNRKTDRERIKRRIIEMNVASMIIGKPKTIE